jgi:hypothetical protein
MIIHQPVFYLWIEAMAIPMYMRRVGQKVFFLDWAVPFHENPPLRQSLSALNITPEARIFRGYKEQIAKYYIQGEEMPALTGICGLGHNIVILFFGRGIPYFAAQRRGCLICSSHLVFAGKNTRPRE